MVDAPVIQYAGARKRPKKSKPRKTKPVRTLMHEAYPKKMPKK